MCRNCELSWLQSGDERSEVVTSAANFDASFTEAIVAFCLHVSVLFLQPILSLHATFLFLDIALFIRSLHVPIKALQNCACMNLKKNHIKLL